MPRATNAIATKTRKKKYFKLAKGYWGRRKNVWSITKNAVEKSWLYNYRDRKVKKRTFRRLWIQRINAGVRQCQASWSYSIFMNELKEHHIDLNRKVLADLVINDFAAFAALVNKVKSVVPPSDKKKIA